MHGRQVIRILQGLTAVARLILTASTSLAWQEGAGPASTAKIALPGPAAAVEAVPAVEELTHAIEAAGFVDLWFDKLGDCPCFVVDDVQMRETRLTAFKPRRAHEAPQTPNRVLYKGPFPQITLEDGQTLRRGQFVTVSEAVYRSLKNTARDQFAFACDIS